MADISRSTYYYYSHIFKKPEKYNEEKQQIQEIFQQNRGRYGYRRITTELRNRSYSINHKTVLKIMHELGLYCTVRMRKYNSYRVGIAGEAVSNLLQRDFYAQAPTQKWVTDLTEFALFGKKIYLSPILDLYNGEIISYSISDHPNFKMIMEMLKKAFRKTPNTQGTIFHSDQGWQYRVPAYQRILKERGIQQSMSRKGNCWDNAVMENFFGLLKTELFYLEQFQSIDHFIKELREYIHYYNVHRIKTKLKGLSPVQYRIQSS